VSDLPHSLLRYQRQLERAVTADLTRRRRRTRAGALAVILGLIVVVLNVMPSGGTDRRLPAVEPASAVERAAAALTTDRKTILHVHMIGRQYDETRPDIRWENESWSGAGGHRMVETPPGGGAVAETEHVKGFDRIWDGERVLEAPTPAPGSAPALNDSFREQILAELRSGRSRVTGAVRRGGREALRITTQSPGQVYIIDAQDYTPIELRTRGTGGGTVLRFVTYERLPVNDETRALLSIAAQHGNAPVVRDADAYRAAIARLFPNG
jgi:hypothetical protein